jgi:hypothetical protein
MRFMYRYSLVLASLVLWLPKLASRGIAQHNLKGAANRASGTDVLAQALAVIHLLRRARRLLGTCKNEPVLAHLDRTTMAGLQAESAKCA